MGWLVEHIKIIFPRSSISANTTFLLLSLLSLPSLPCSLPAENTLPAPVTTKKIFTISHTNYFRAAAARSERFVSLFPVARASALCGRTVERNSGEERSPCICLYVPLATPLPLVGTNLGARSLFPGLQLAMIWRVSQNNSAFPPRYLPVKAGDLCDFICSIDCCCCCCYSTGYTSNAKWLRC